MVLLRVWITERIMKVDSIVVMNLTAPTQRFFGRLIDLNPSGITIRGVDLDAFDDWMDNIATDEESGVKPTTTFFPLHRVEKMVAGTSYKNFTCPNPTTRFSARSSKTVNVCLQVAHRPGRTERLTLVWERNGAFAGKTRVALPASKATVRTRAHMKISANRVGSWSVRAVSDRDAPLAQTTFDVVR